MKPAVLFVCTGNICRSPTAHALLVHKARAARLDVEVDSAAISNEEWGRPADPRSVAEAKRRGIAMHAHRARQVRGDDFERFHHIVGMTADHCDDLRHLAPAHAGKVRMLMEFADDGAVDVPDPWYGGEKHFVRAFDMIDRGVDGLVAHLARDGPPSR